MKIRTHGLHKVILCKEDFKFSCAHFTIWNANTAERLHGHNYYVSVEFLVDSIETETGLSIPFEKAKSLIRSLTKEWDEYVLLPKNSPFLRIEQAGGQVTALLGAKHYQFPTEDVKLLDCSNITVENLCRLLAESLLRELQGLAAPVNSIEVSIEETRGQSVSYQVSHDYSTS